MYTTPASLALPLNFVMGAVTEVSVPVEQDMGPRLAAIASDRAT